MPTAPSFTVAIRANVRHCMYKECYRLYDKRPRLASFDAPRAQQHAARAGATIDERTVSVTLRMPASMIDALKAEARRQGLRGYQTLMKQWIDERLNGEPSISTTRLTTILAQLHVAQEDLARLVEEHGDGGE